MFRNVIAVVWAAGFSCAIVSADTLVLKDGQRLGGTVTEIDADTYAVEQGGKRVTVNVSDVEEWISGNTGPAAPLELKPVEQPVAEPATTPEPATLETATTVEAPAEA